MRYAIGCLLDYNYFDDYNKAMTIDLSKQKADDVEQKAIKLINFTGNLERNLVANTTIFSLLKK